MDWDYRCHMEVRDYEIDMQGVVNHAIYLNYLEYCRAKFVKTLGIDVYDCHEKGYDIIVINIEQSYKSSLRPNQKFYINLKMSREGRLRVIFDHEIRREDDDSLVLTAKVKVVCLNLKTGRVCSPDVIKGFA